MRGKLGNNRRFRAALGGALGALAIAAALGGFGGAAADAQEGADVPEAVSADAQALGSGPWPGMPGGGPWDVPASPPLNI